MVEPPDSTPDGETLQVDPLPESLRNGATVLVASTGDPFRDAVTLRLLRSEGTAEDTAFVVTTTESADRTTPNSPAGVPWLTYAMSANNP